MSILLIVDDDDWFAPNIFNYLEKVITPSTDIVVWKHTIFNHNKGVINIDNNVISTNNFALTKSGIEKLHNKLTKDIKDERIDCLAFSPFDCHSKIHKRVFKKTILHYEHNPQLNIFLKNIDKFDVKFQNLKLDHKLNISNKSTASTLSMLRIHKCDLIGVLQKMSKTKFESCLWASEEIKALNNLNQKLKSRQIKIL